MVYGVWYMVYGIWYMVLWGAPRGSPRRFPSTTPDKPFGGPPGALLGVSPALGVSPTGWEVKAKLALTTYQFFMTRSAKLEQLRTAPHMVYGIWDMGYGIWYFGGPWGSPRRFPSAPPNKPSGGPPRALLGVFPRPPPTNRSGSPQGLS